jgi:flagellar motor switch protein FliM
MVDDTEDNENESDISSQDTLIPEDGDDNEQSKDRSGQNESDAAQSDADQSERDVDPSLHESADNESESSGNDVGLELDNTSIDSNQTANNFDSLMEESDDNHEMESRGEAVDDEDIDALLFGAEFREGNALNDLDSLMDSGKSSSYNARKGMEAILRKTMIYYERLPMLEVVFDRLIRLLSTNLRNFTSDNVEIRMETTKSTRFGDYLNSIPLPAMLGVFKAKEWDNQGLIVVDSALIYSVVDVLLGGRHNATGLATDARTYTTIECNLIEKLMCVLLEDLGIAFEPICSVEFIFERLELNPNFAMISRASNAGILVKLGVEIDDRDGKISLFLPYATIEPIRELLLQNFMGEKFGRDSIWEHHLVKELKETDITFDIQLVSEMMRLSTVLNWEVGDTIQFASTPQTLVTAMSGERALFRGVVGHKNGKVAVKIKDNLLEKEELEGGAL